MAGSTTAATFVGLRAARPAENIRQYPRKNHLALRVLDDDDAIVDACCKAWNDLLAMPDRLASITRRNWAKVS